MHQKEPEIVGAAYKQLVLLVKKYAQSDTSILFVGETGTGKERFAKLYMESSERKGKKQTENCGAVSDQLLRSEVFGHVKGAFTDAVENRAGLLKTCNNGILFLDELGDASPDFQAAILRVTEGHGFRPLGSDKEETVNTLIIAATNRPVEIREDLKHRFQILPVPPLQRFDIPALAEHFLGSPLKEDVLKTLMARDYPGNVRELEKHCKQLYVEKEDRIFSKKASTNMIRVGTFDYERFRLEFSVWDRYISPILVKYNLDYSYKYFLFPTSAHAHQKGGTPRVRHALAQQGGRNLARYDIGKRIAELIKNLLTGKKEERTLREFVELLDNCFADETLPVLLEGINRYIAVSGPSQKSKPELAPLLDLNWKEASEKFKAEYFSYHLQINNQDRTEAAKAIGMNKKTFETNLSRLKDALKTASDAQQ